jgi:hypothetical protein
MEGLNESANESLCAVLHSVICHIEVHAPKVALGWESAARLVRSALAHAVRHPQTGARVCRHSPCSSRLLSERLLVAEFSSWLAADAHRHSMLRYVYAPQVSGFCSVACWRAAGGDSCPLLVVDLFDV